MDGKVTWKNNMVFEAVGNSGKAFIFDSGPVSVMIGPSPMEALALSLAGCTAMDVISILQKKQQKVTNFEVRVHCDRAADAPKVYTRATLEYVVTGHEVDEQAVARAIQLSVEKYCPIHAMLSQAFPINLTYVVMDHEGHATAEGTFMPAEET